MSRISNYLFWFIASTKIKIFRSLVAALLFLALNMGLMGQTHYEILHDAGGIDINADNQQQINDAVQRLVARFPS